MAPDGRSILNSNRPSNPFIPTTESDWRESRKVFATNRAHASPTAREGLHKLPSPFDTSQPPQSTVDCGKRELQAPAKERSSPNSNQTSTPSMLSSTARKPAPSIPKKPASLTGSSGQQAGNESEGKVSRKDPAVSLSLPAVQRNMTPSVPGTELPLRTVSVKAKATHNNQHHQQSPSWIGGPPLPPRRPEDTARNAHDLMDDDDETASSIPTLQPMRRT